LAVKVSLWRLFGNVYQQKSKAHPEHRQLTYLTKRAAILEPILSTNYKTHAMLNYLFSLMVRRIHHLL